MSAYCCFVVVSTLLACTSILYCRDQQSRAVITSSHITHHSSLLAFCMVGAGAGAVVERAGWDVTRPGREKSWNAGSHIEVDFKWLDLQFYFLSFPFATLLAGTYVMNVSTGLIGGVHGARPVISRQTCRMSEYPTIEGTYNSILHTLLTSYTYSIDIQIASCKHSC